jgi:pimeloyl-ACP methyl ester carboxylesterase
MTTPDNNPDQQVSWRVDDIDVEATLTRPRGAGPFAAIAMVAGSGPTDRNWNSPLIPGTNGSAALLAQVLTDQNFITLRYDKRASGPHVAENMPKLLGKISMESHRAELAGGVRLLASRSDVDLKRLYALTSSEGCIHALNYQLQAKDHPFAGLILTGAPARSIGEVARGQIAAQLAAAPGGDAFLAAYDSAMADFAAGRPVNVDDSLPEMLRMVIGAASAPMNLPFTRELWVTDPTQLAASVTVPVLVLIGKKDVQVGWQVDGSRWEKIAKDHNNMTIVYPDNANHVLKHEPRAPEQLSPTDIMNSYSAADGMLDQQVVETITAWLSAQRTP